MPENKKVIKVMTSEEYKEQGGGVCPVCGSYDITYWAVEVDEHYLSEEVGCNECGSTWYDIHGRVLLGYESLTPGEATE